MGLSEILSEFGSIKDQIRKNSLAGPHSGGRSDGLSLAMDYSDMAKYVVGSLFNLTRNSFGGTVPGIGVFLYGSPGRNEMVCESDLDVLLAYRDNSQVYLDFKSRFGEFVSPFRFCKIDLPEWGTMDELALFASRSITEGNQVLECRFVEGDRDINRQVREIQERFGGIERMTRNIIFQRFYFDQYFRQRMRRGAVNVKYCDGGSRDFLFLHWFNLLMGKKHLGWDKTGNGERPVAEIALSNIYKNGLMTSLEFSRAIEALNFNVLLRNEVLLANKDTPDEGLTLLDDETVGKVFERNPPFLDDYGIRSSDEIKKRFDEQRYHIAVIKNRIWNFIIDDQSKERGQRWANDFKMAYSPGTPKDDRRKLLHHDDILIKTGLIWGASNSGQGGLIREISEIERDSTSWEVLASLASSPLCPPEFLDYVGTGIGKEMAYGYILRIISRNPRTNTETIRNIANDDRVAIRYAQCAKAALKHGRGAANHQV